MVQPHCRHGLTTPTHPQTTYHTPAKAAALLEDGRVWHRCTTTRKPCLACTRQHGLLLGQPSRACTTTRAVHLGSEDQRTQNSASASWLGGREGPGELGEAAWGCVQQLAPPPCPACPATQRPCPGPASLSATSLGDHSHGKAGGSNGWSCGTGPWPSCYPASGGGRHRRILEITSTPLPQCACRGGGRHITEKQSRNALEISRSFESAS